MSLRSASVLQSNSRGDLLGYDLHVVRTADWLDASSNPISKGEIDHLITFDATLEWSKEDFVDMKNETGETTRYYMIEWNGVSCFWWYRDQIVCSSADEAQTAKLLRIARALSAFLVGDDGEKYELRKTLLGKERIVTVV
jgi:hypothetical protein